MAAAASALLRRSRSDAASFVTVVGKVMPGAQRVIEYHLIARGTCWGHAIGQEAVRLREGDLIVFPQGDAHVLSSARGSSAASSAATNVPSIHCSPRCRR